MTDKEAIQVLAVLKAAYPNSYKNMTTAEAAGTVNVWAIQFANVPVEVVIIAVNKLIATSTFPPAISEVKKKIGSIYWEAQEALNMDKIKPCLTEEGKAAYESIKAVTEKFKYNSDIEPTLTEIIRTIDETLLLGSDNNERTLIQGESKA